MPDRLCQAAGGLIGRSFDLLREFAAVLWLILRARPEEPAVIGISVVYQQVLSWIVYFIAGRLHVEIGLLTDRQRIVFFSSALLLSIMPISLGGWGVQSAAGCVAEDFAPFWNRHHRELAEAVRKAGGYEGELSFDATKPDGTPRKLLDTSRLTALGWKPKIRLEAGIELTTAWFREHVAQARL